MREAIFQIHLWMGLIGGLLITVLGLSGSLIVFRQEIYRAANARLVHVAKADASMPLEQLAETVLRASPGGEIVSIELPHEGQETTRFLLQFEGARKSPNADVYVNPYTAEILGSPHPGPRWLDWVANLHHNLLAGRTGRLIEGVLSILLLALCATGIVIWWPGRRHLKRNLTINTRLSGWRLALDVHKATGFWSLVVLAMFAATGISFTWNVRNFVYSVTRSSPPSRARLETTWKRGDSTLSLDELLGKATSAMPTGKAVWINPSFERRRFTQIALRLPNDFEREGAVNSVFLDPSSGEVLRVDRLGQAPIGERLVSALGPFHFGRFGVGPIGGLPIKIVWVLLGLVPGALFFTGFLPWWNRVASKAGEGRRPSRAEYGKGVVHGNPG